jgi:hypothetical protein
VIDTDVAGGWLLHLDDRGLVWRISIETGESGPVFGRLERGWSAPGCTGEEYVLNRAPTPRFTFAIEGDEIVRVAHDHADPARVAVCSRLIAGECVTHDCNERGTIPLEGTIPTPSIEAPAPRPAPLRPALVPHRFAMEGQS